MLILPHATLYHVLYTIYSIPCNLSYIYIPYWDPFGYVVFGAGARHLPSGRAYALGQTIQTALDPDCGPSSDYDGGGCSQGSYPVHC